MNVMLEMRSQGLTSGVCKRIRHRSSKPRRLVAREVSSSWAPNGDSTKSRAPPGPGWGEARFSAVLMVRLGSFCIWTGPEMKKPEVKSKVECMFGGYVLFIDLGALWARFFRFPSLVSGDLMIFDMSVHKCGLGGLLLVCAKGFAVDLRNRDDWWPERRAALSCSWGFSWRGDWQEALNCSSVHGWHSRWFR